MELLPVLLALLISLDHVSSGKKMLLLYLKQEQKCKAVCSSKYNCVLALLILLNV